MRRRRQVVIRRLRRDRPSGDNREIIGRLRWLPAARCLTMSVAPCLRPNLVLSLSHSVGALRPKPPRQIVTERGEPPRQLFTGRGRDFGAQFSLSSPREESHQGSSSSGEEDTQPPSLLSSPREESHQGDSSSGEEVYSTTQPALITEREEPPRQLFIGRGEDFGTQLYPSFDASSRRRSLTSTTGFGALLLLAAACCCLLLLAAAACRCLPLLLASASCCCMLLLLPLLRAAACCCCLLLLAAACCCLLLAAAGCCLLLAAAACCLLLAGCCCSPRRFAGSALSEPTPVTPIERRAASESSSRPSAADLVVRAPVVPSTRAHAPPCAPPCVA